MGVHIHLLRLSDEFRRNAEPQGNPLFEKLVIITRALAKELIDYDPSYGSVTWNNRDILAHAQIYLLGMVEAADGLGKKKMCLPFREDNPLAKVIKDELLSAQGAFYDQRLFNRFMFMKHDYSMDLSHLGAINHRRDTIFDRKVRIVADIAPQIAHAKT